MRHMLSVTVTVSYEFEGEEDFGELEDLLEDLVQGTVTETQRNASINRQVLDLARVRHLDDELVDGLQPHVHVLVAHGEQLEQVLHHRLQRRVVKPRQLCNLRQ